ncbi:MAG: pantetheine-phosphate adenylyltransferase [Oscillospiraceae bacterium]|jgi:pantetheine-phosphate adenylyltransferase|nr:pantetheine-phosphate adenylyltransferase [Oscillospiraceae bacterium]
MSLAIYPGSFDPVTNGHLDIITRAVRIFDRVIVTVMQNQRKTPLFTAEERMDMLRRVTAGLPGIEVDTSAVLLADYASARGARVLIKGLRAMSDFELEFQMALINRKLNTELDTVFLTTTETNQYLSSSVVKEIGALGGNISAFVPPGILDTVTAKFNRGR